MRAKTWLVVAAAMLAAACRTNDVNNNAEPLSLPTPVDRTGAGVTVAQFGEPLTITGAALKVGDKAPDVVLRTPRGSDLNLASLRGKVVLMSVVPELGTTVCDRSTQRFEEAARGLPDDVAVLTISSDDPFTQDRWARENNIRDVQLLSDSAHKSFGPAYGVQVRETGRLARAVLVVDAKGVIRYIEMQRELARDPNYEAALAAVDKLRQQK